MNPPLDEPQQPPPGASMNAARPPSPGQAHHTGSPRQPSYSPVTPTLSHASSAAPDGTRVESPPEQWIEEPPALPVSLDDNSDAIALRAALSVLQLQRQQALRDIRNLDQMKQAALSAPEEFVKNLQEGRLSQPAGNGVEIEVDDGGETGSDAQLGHPKFPKAQNVVRCPPVEWAKYHVTAEPLDQMHDMQRRFPGLGDAPDRGSEQPRPHQIAAPYRAFVDRVEEPSRRKPRPSGS